MKTLFAALSVLLLVGTAAQANHSTPTPPPGYRGGGYGYGGHGGYVPPPPPPPGYGYGYGYGYQGGNWHGGDHGGYGDNRGYNHGDDHGYNHGDDHGDDQGDDHGDDHGWDHGGPRGPGGYQPPPPPRPVGITQFISCESHGYDVSNCAAPGTIVRAEVSNQRSFAACELGSTYGYQGSQIWVKDGCRATFAVTFIR